MKSFLVAIHAGSSNPDIARCICIGYHLNFMLNKRMHKQKSGWGRPHWWGYQRSPRSTCCHERGHASPSCEYIYQTPAPFPKSWIRPDICHVASRRFDHQKRECQRILKPFWCDFHFLNVFLSRCQEQEQEE